MVVVACHNYHPATKNPPRGGAKFPNFKHFDIFSKNTKGGIPMGKSKGLDPRDLDRVQKMLEDRTQKVVKITPKEAAEKLESQLRQAIKNGYEVREISQMLKEVGFPIPAKVIDRLRRKMEESDMNKTEASDDSSSIQK
jgi:hypothetical protein